MFLQIDLNNPTLEFLENDPSIAERFGAETKFASVLSADLKSEPKVIKTSNDVFYGKTVVISTGADPRELGVDGERELRGRGVSYCAACDGMFFSI